MTDQAEEPEKAEADQPAFQEILAIVQFQDGSYGVENRRNSDLTCDHLMAIMMCFRLWFAMMWDRAAPPPNLRTTDD